MLDPVSSLVLHKVGGLAQAEVIKRFLKLATFNDERHALDRVETALAWSAELKAAAAEALPYLRLKLADLDAQVEQLEADSQTVRIYRNLGFEALREAIDERRKMLAHAAAGILDPEMPVERKARVERRLRELDPVDVRTLYGLSLMLRALDAKEAAKILFRESSGDVLVASGCVRLETSGNGGAGSGISIKPLITELGHDLLLVLRSYVRTRGSSFPVPGRDFKPGDRSEDEARNILARIPSLMALLAYGRGKGRASFESLEFTPVLHGEAPASTSQLTFYIHPNDEHAASLLKQLDAEAAASGEIAVTIASQPFGLPDREKEILRVEALGRRDVLRHLADDFEVLWLW